MGILRARACEPAAIGAPQATSAQGYYNAPRLAGQRVDYLVNQLQAFATHKRDEFLSTKYMWNAAAHLDPLILRNLAAYFSALPPEAAMDGDSELAAEGKIIFENGVPDENIAACQACHGPEAQGVRGDSAPRRAFLQLSQASARAVEPGPRRIGGPYAESRAVFVAEIKSPPSRRI